MARRKAAGECLQCAWPTDRKGNHGVKDCVRPIKLDQGTASYPKAKEYQKMKVAGMELSSEEEDTTDSGSPEESEDSEESEASENSEECEEDDLEGEYFDDDKEEQQEEKEEGNLWDSPSESN